VRIKGSNRKISPVTETGRAEALFQTTLNFSVDSRTRIVFFFASEHLSGLPERQGMNNSRAIINALIDNRRFRRYYRGYPMVRPRPEVFV